ITTAVISAATAAVRNRRRDTGLPMGSPLRGRCAPGHPDIVQGILWADLITINSARAAVINPSSKMLARPYRKNPPTHGKIKACTGEPDSARVLVNRGTRPHNTQAPA